jgi:hypothetical protein
MLINMITLGNLGQDHLTCWTIYFYFPPDDGPGRLVSIRLTSHITHLEFRLESTESDGFSFYTQSHRILLEPYRARSRHFCTT